MQNHTKTNLPLQQLADAANTLTRFLGVRDLPKLSHKTLQRRYGIEQADVLILFGGTIPFGCDVAAAAWRRGVARHLMIVGGIGHTTQSLRTKFRTRFPDMDIDDKSEAELIASYLSRKYDIRDILLETKSTNCGNNVTYALAKLKEAAIPAKSIIIMQEPSMQRRMAAAFAKELKHNKDTTIINYAPYRPYLTAKNGPLRFIRQYWGLWDIEHYITLLLGDISRLRDDTQGYGPNGKGFITHVDIPPEVEKAFHILNVSQLGTIRTANPSFRS